MFTIGIEQIDKHNQGKRSQGTPAADDRQGLCSTRGLACELGPQGIIVNGICPGLSDTKSSRSIPGFDEVLRYAVGQTPRGRLVSGDDVAGAAAFLASDQAAMIAGQFLVIDGGRSIMG